MFGLNRKKCLIIDPGINFLGHLKGFNYPGHFPYGALSVASFLEKNGLPVSLVALDNYLQQTGGAVSREKILTDVEGIITERIRGNNISVVGISVTYTPQYTVSEQIAQIVKRVDPNIKVIIGGQHVSFLDQQVLTGSKSIDAVARGEGEWTMLDFVNAVLAKRNLAGIDGISFKDGSLVIRNPDRAFGDISQLSFMNFGLIPSSFYRGRLMNVAACRGCMYACKFCAEQIFWGNKVRRVPVEKLLHEAQALFNKFKIGYLSFEDSMLPIESDYFRQLASGLKRIKKGRWGHFVTRVDAVNESALKLVKDTGFQYLIFGVETASDKVLAAMNKKITVDKVEKAFNLSKSSGLTVGSFWLVGHPGDSYEESQKSIFYLDKWYSQGLIDNATIARFVPYPGSDFFNNPASYGIRIFHYRWEEWRRYRSNGVCDLSDFPDEKIVEIHAKMQSISMQSRLFKDIYNHQGVGN